MSGNKSGNASADVSDDGRWLTYDELAQIRGISRPSAERLVLRNRWRRQRDNQRVVRILVPLDRLSDDTSDHASADTSADVSSDVSGAVEVFEAAAVEVFEAALEAIKFAHAGEISALRERAETAERRAEAADTDRRAAQVRADQAERERDTERQRADRSEQGREGERGRADALRDRMDILQAQLTAVEAEGAASDVTVAELTAQLREAHRHAEEEAQAAEARREAEAAARRSLGRLARLRAAWRGE
jgi:chromosome segregation ATPase